MNGRKGWQAGKLKKLENKTVRRKESEDKESTQ
jgi:hypothetical protein